MTYLCQTKVAERALIGLIIEQEVTRFDIPMDDASCVSVFQSSEETSHVFSDVIDVHVTVEVL